MVGLLRKVGATSYLSGPAARAYLVPALLEEAGIALEYKSYGYREYPQLHPPYDPNVSILDLLFMMGPESTRHLDRDAQ